MFILTAPRAAALRRTLTTGAQAMNPRIRIRYTENARLTEYQNIKHSYMHSNVEFLDRHKIAAVIIYAIVETKVLKPKVNYINNVYIGNYKLAISAGLSYMQYELNHELIRQDMKPIDQFIFPDTINGNKSYLEYLVNLLYLTEKENELSLLYLLYLANIFFLIEQYTLCMNY